MQRVTLWQLELIWAGLCQPALPQGGVDELLVLCFFAGMCSLALDTVPGMPDDKLLTLLNVRHRHCHLNFNF